MRNIFRRILAISVCLFLCVSVLTAQNTTGTADDTSNIEKSFTIPSSNTTGFSESNTGTGSSFWLFFRMVLVLAIICLIIWLVGKFIKKKMDPGAEPDLYLKKTAQLTLAPGRTIQVVTLRDRAYVLGVSDGGISVIDKIEGKEAQSADKELIDDMNLKAAENLSAKPQDFASMISNLASSSKNTENFIKNRRLSFKNNGERK